VRKIKEVLRLKFEVGLGLRQTDRSCSIGLGTVHEYPQRAEAAGITWPLGEGWDEDRLETALFGGPRARPATLPMPDFAELHQQRQLNRHLTQQLLWEEYCQANPDGYRYSRFCELFKRWRRKQDVVLREEHKAGEKLFVDWAGTTISIYDPRGGPCSRRICSLPSWEPVPTRTPRPLVTILQRALQPGAGTGRSALHAHDGRAFSEGPARGVTPTRTRPWTRCHDCRAPSAFSSGAPGMDAVADGALGSDHRPTDCSAV
jgi:hypothetical protein